VEVSNKKRKKGRSRKKNLQMRTSRGGGGGVRGNPRNHVLNPLGEWWGGTQSTPKEADKQVQSYSKGSLPSGGGTAKNTGRRLGRPPRVLSTEKNNERTGAIMAPKRYTEGNKSPPWGGLKLDPHRTAAKQIGGLVACVAKWHEMTIQLTAEKS